MTPKESQPTRGLHRKKRVLALVSDAFGGRGGIAQYNRDFFLSLSSFPGCEKIVVIPRAQPDPAGKLPPNIFLLTKSTGGKGRFIATMAEAVAKEGPFDHIICGHIHLLPVAWAASLVLRAPVTLLIYGIDVWGPSASRLGNFLCRWLRGFISISEITAERFSAWAPVELAKGAILPNAVDLSRFSPGEKPPELVRRYGLEGKKVILSFGRLVSFDRFKGMDEILDALPSLAATVPEVVYLIAGDGPDKGRLQTKARDLGVQDRVVFTGYVDEEEKVDHYRLADAFVMPSRGEGFGFVIIEALACGVPVVASSVDGGREAVRHGQLGILVNPERREEIINAVLASLSQPSRSVPDGLSYFSFEEFEKRAHTLFASMFTDGKKNN